MNPNDASVNISLLTISWLSFNSGSALICMRCICLDLPLCLILADRSFSVSKRDALFVPCFLALWASLSSPSFLPISRKYTHTLTHSLCLFHSVSLSVSLSLSVYVCLSRSVYLFHIILSCRPISICLSSSLLFAFSAILRTHVHTVTLSFFFSMSVFLC